MTFKNTFYFYNRHYQTVETYIFNLIFNIYFKITKIYCLHICMKLMIVNTYLFPRYLEYIFSLNCIV